MIVEINTALVRKLIATQFPQWAELPIVLVEPGGWDNRTLRLGDSMLVRLPSAERYASKVEKEHRWLPKFAPLLSLPIPVPLAMGKPDEEYPWPWSVYGWIEGDTATTERVKNLSEFAASLAEFLKALQKIDTLDGPSAGPHNFYRGGSLTVYDVETRDAIKVLQREVDTAIVTEIWEKALTSTWTNQPVWIHGDVSADNLLVRNGNLSAVIDFGGMGVGDPACDLVIAWTFLAGESRDVFRKAMALDEDTWARSRGWALWKALITIAEHKDANPSKANEARRVLSEIISEYKNAT